MGTDLHKYKPEMSETNSSLHILSGALCGASGLGDRTTGIKTTFFFFLTLGECSQLQLRLFQINTKRVACDLLLPTQLFLILKTFLRVVYSKDRVAESETERSSILLMAVLAGAVPSRRQEAG